MAVCIYIFFQQIKTIYVHKVRSQSTVSSGTMSGISTAQLHATVLIHIDWEAASHSINQASSEGSIELASAWNCCCWSTSTPSFCRLPSFVVYAARIQSSNTCSTLSKWKTLTVNLVHAPQWPNIAYPRFGDVHYGQKLHYIPHDWKRVTVAIYPFFIT